MPRRSFSSSMSLFFPASLAAVAVAHNALGRCQVCEPCDGIQICLMPDNGTGTVDLYSGHSNGCGVWGDSNGYFEISDGLPAGTTIQCRGPFRPAFFDIFYAAGGSLGGEIQQFPAALTWHMTGTGVLSGFSRTITLDTQCEAHSGPRTPGNRVQSFDTDMFRMAGQLPPGDPDFDLLRITAGTGFGLPSPGHTTLTRLPGGSWAVDSFFDITYRIDFVGTPGGSLSGMAGSTTGTTHASNGQPLPQLAPPNPLDSANTPAENMPIRIDLGASGPAQIIDGLPPGSTIDIPIEMLPLSLMGIQPGTLGGPAYQMQSEMTLPLQGTGTLAGYKRVLVMPHILECHVSPIPPGAPVQELETQMFMVQGQLPPGDPDFDLLRITAGGGFGMPSPGHTTLTRMPAGNWAVDSFFDITYRIDFIGAPGGPFGGMSGSTTGTIRMKQGGPLPKYSVDAFGLPHTALGAASVVASDPDNGDTFVTVDNIGSSGQDGVSIALTNVPNSGTGTPTFGLEGWSSAVDLGPAGAIPVGAMLRTKGTIHHGSGGGAGGGAGGSIAMTMTHTGGGQASVALQVGCNNPCGGTFCDCCPEYCNSTLTVTLYNNGVVVASQDFASGWNPVVLDRPFGGTNAGPVRVAAWGSIGPAPGIGAEWNMCMIDPAPVSMQLAGSPPVIADAMVFTVSVPGLPWYPAFSNVEITGGNLPNNMMTLRSAGVHVKHAHVVQYRESDFDFLTRMSGPGDLNGDGRPDLVIADFDSTGTNGIEFFGPGSEPFRGVWPWGSMGSIDVEMRVLDTPDGSLPPNGSIEMSAAQGFFDLTGGAPVDTIARFVRCMDATCAAVEMHVDFSELGATSMRCEAWHNGAMVAVATGVAGSLAGTGPVNTQPTSCNKVYLDSGQQGEQITLGFAPTMVQLTDGTAWLCDELRVSPENPLVIPTEILSMSLTGTNLCGLAILDVEVEPVPVPPCPADIAPPGGNGSVGVPDLLFIINNWGLCIIGLPCPADIAPPGGNGSVGVPDLLFIINNWGPCP